MERRKNHNRRGGLMTALALPVALTAANMMEREQFSVRPHDSLSRKLVNAIPSAFIAPEMTGNKAADTAVAVALGGAGLELAKGKNSPRELATMALGAQGLAVAAAIGVEKAGLLSDEEKQIEDVGISAVAVAWMINRALHGVADAESTKERALWGAGAAILAGVSTVGSYMTRDSIGGKLDATAHASGVIAGTAAFAFSKLRRSSAK